MADNGEKKSPPAAAPPPLSKPLRRRLGMPDVTPETKVIAPKRDAALVPGQRYWVMSYVAPTGAKARSDQLYVKCSGAFATAEEACAQAERIRNAEDRIDVFVVEMYELLPVPIPKDIDALVAHHYQDERLTRYMEATRQSALAQRREMEARMARDRARAEEAMRRATGRDYVETQPPPEVQRMHDEQEAAEAKNRMNYTPPTSFQTDSVLKAVADFTRLNRNFDLAAAKELIATIAHHDRVAQGIVEEKDPCPAPAPSTPPPPTPPTPPTPPAS
jgi:hypothetical protein